MNQQITIGAPVYDANGSHLGTVNEQTVPHKYLAVQKGVVIPGNIYVPITAIQETAPDGGVRLNLTEEDLSDPSYSQPPAGAGAATPGGMTT